MFDRSGPLFVKKAKGNLVFSIRFGKEILKGRPVVKVDPPSLSPISDMKKDPVLFATDFMLHP